MLCWQKETILTFWLSWHHLVEVQEVHLIAERYSTHSPGSHDSLTEITDQQYMAPQSNMEIRFWKNLLCDLHREAILNIFSLFNLQVESLRSLPRLFKCSNASGKFQVTEISDFDQEVYLAFYSYFLITLLQLFNPFH